MNKEEFQETIIQLWEAFEDQLNKDILEDRNDMSDTTSLMLFKGVAFAVAMQHAVDSRCADGTYEYVWKTVQKDMGEAGVFDVEGQG